MVISMDRWKNKVAIVTGTSAGLGVEISKLLLESGVNVVGFARRLERMQENAKKWEKLPGKFYPVQVDITNEDDIIKGFEWTLKNVGPVSILINNAGILVSSPLASGETALWKKLIDTNVMGLSIATREAIKIMNEHEIAGHIIHVNSIGGHQISDFPLNMYHASKYAVTALAETLRIELHKANSKIKISSLSPGGIKTEIASGFTGFDQVLEEVNNLPILAPEDVAETAIFILSTPPNVLVKELMVAHIGEAR